MDYLFATVVSITLTKETEYMKTTLLLN